MSCCTALITSHIHAKYERPNYSGDVDFDGVACAICHQIIEWCDFICNDIIWETMIVERIGTDLCKC
jgi:hypothetical protein